MAAKKILFLVGDYVEDYEAMVPFQALHGPAWPAHPQGLARFLEVLGTKITL